jgi:hypothetical protein
VTKAFPWETPVTINQHSRFQQWKGQKLKQNILLVYVYKKEKGTQGKIGRL